MQKKIVKEMKVLPKINVEKEIRSINNRRRFMDQITGMIIDDVEIEDYFNCLFSIDIDKDFERLLYLLDTKKTFYTKIKK